MNIRRVPNVLRGAAFGAAVLLLAAPAFAAPKVVASIKPVHSLVAGVMEGVGEPTLIVRGAGSPHTYAMRPADARALSEADIVFWIGPELETFLQKPLEALSGKAHVVTLMREANFRLLPTREGGLWEGHDHAGEHHEEAHGHGHNHSHGHDHGHDDAHAHGDYDAHVWLDIDNAKRIVAAALDELREHDAANTGTYAANAERMNARLDALDAELRDRLAPVQGRPYIVFHDAYHYLEARYDLNAIGAITVSPEQRPSAQRLSEIRSRIRELGAACVFAEPQFEPALVRTIAEGTQAGTGVLDPEGADIPDGPDLYFNLMRANADALVSCLAPR